VTPDPATEGVESPRDVKKFLFKLDDLSGSLASLDQNEDQNKQVFRADPPGVNVVKRFFFVPDEEAK